ncbi:DNA-binding transcriptional repressor MarR [Saccharomonospora xinjiangensis]|nr:DNA-binding transcriptional repressor MarR [Saccharomonospora xinjiangensis]
MAFQPSRHHLCSGAARLPETASLKRRRRTTQSDKGVLSGDLLGRADTSHHVRVNSRAQDIAAATFSYTGPVPSAPDDDELMTWWSLVIEGCLTTHDRLTGEITEQLGLSPVSFEVLLRLVRAPGHRLPMTHLARATSLSSGGFTKVADRMCAADLIHRSPSGKDRRITYACLTEHGADVARQARTTCADLLRHLLLAPLGHEESRALAETMRVLRDSSRK